MTAPAPPPAPAAAVCPSCKAAASGKFCSNCGAPLAGAQCGACHAPLTPGARFCHRCGTEAGASPQSGAASSHERGMGTALPWAVAAIALVALIALVAGQRFGRPSAPAVASAPAGDAPIASSGASGVDISQMTPEQRAERLYDRIMSLAERGRSDSVQFFAPMAIQAYAMLGALNADQRYDLGRIAIVSGEPQLARAQADTMLAARPTHLLGLLLAADAALLRGDARAESTFTRRFVAAEATERTVQLPEYQQHANDIRARLAAARPGSSRASTPNP